MDQKTKHKIMELVRTGQLTRREAAKQFGVPYQSITKICLGLPKDRRLTEQWVNADPTPEEIAEACVYLRNKHLDEKRSEVYTPNGTTAKAQRRTERIRAKH